MYDSSAINDLMQKVEMVAHEHRALQVTALTIRIGALAQLTSDQFREQFAQTAAGTLAEGAQIEIEESTNLEDPTAHDITLIEIVISGEAGR